MSLIFEALKKLEREKDAPDRGVVVVGPGAWGEREPRSRARTAAAVGLVLVGLGLAAFALRSRPAPPQAPPQAAASPFAASESAGLPMEAPIASRSSGEHPPPPPRLVVPTAPPPRAAAAAPETIQITPPPDPVAPREPEFRLNAISTREGYPVALLNDRLVREGDLIEGVKVLHIGEDYVEIEVRGERRTIRF